MFLMIAAIWIIGILVGFLVMPMAMDGRNFPTYFVAVVLWPLCLSVIILVVVLWSVVEIFGSLYSMMR